MKLLLWLIAPLWLFSQTSNETSIRMLQDQRTERLQELKGFLHSDTPRERELALLALANIQDTSSFEYVFPLLSDAVPSVRSMAAFAVGMIGHPKGTGYLFRRLSVEREEKCVAALFNAIGMNGTADDLKKIINQSEDYRAEWKPYVAQSIYRFANRKVKDLSATRYAVALLDDQPSMINACYALMRISDTAIVRSRGDRIRRLTNNSSPLIRMWGCTLMGLLDDDMSTKRLITIAKNDKDWRVRVNAVRALRTKLPAKNDLIRLIGDANEHVALAAAASFDAMTSGDSLLTDSVQCIGLLRSGRVIPSAGDELRILLAKHLGERAIPLIGEWKSGKPYAAAQRIRAYGETGSVLAIPVIKDAIRQTGSSLVTIAGLESYQKIARRGNDEIKKDFLKTAVMLFARKDAGISYSAAVAFQDSSFPAPVRSIFRSSLLSSFTAMRSPADLEPMVELLNVFAEIGDTTVLPAVAAGLSSRDKVIRVAAEKAYRAITGKEATPTAVNASDAYTPFFHISDLAKLDRYTGADVKTSKGKIRITFEKEAAPLTVLNFILLAEKKFYDSLSFHRVVSNFVIQGGDPLGNGSGGPDHSIRTEVHPNATYRTGAVGMASAGKDTEGSQWFITHCPTPHLDFRYTVFGYTRDNAVVDRIMIGDTIEMVTLF